MVDDRLLAIRGLDISGDELRRGGLSEDFIIDYLELREDLRRALRALNDEIAQGGGGAVDSVFGRTGAVVSEAGDYSVAQISGLQSDLDAKQDTLVSGTNIRTINGETLLGSTDLTISGAEAPITGTGSPEGSVTANPGRLYVEDTNEIYLKVTGTGNTGWLSFRADLVSAYDSIVTADGPIHYYRLEDASGLTLADDIGSSPLNLNTGTLNAPSIVAGSPRAVQSTTASGSAIHGTFPTTNFTAFTIEFWASGSQNTTFPGFCNIASDAASDASNNAQGSSMDFYFDGNNSGRYSFWDGRTVFRLPAQSGESTSDITGHHVVTYDGSTIRRYRNGQFMVSFAYTGTFSSIRNIIIGSQAISSTTFRSNYVFSKFALYDTALSATQVLNHYNAGI